MKDSPYFHWKSVSDLQLAISDLCNQYRKNLKLFIILPGFLYFDFIYTSNMIIQPIFYITSFSFNVAAG
jgi:hypothetical protein